MPWLILITQVVLNICTISVPLNKSAIRHFGLGKVLTTSAQRFNVNIVFIFEHIKGKEMDAFKDRLSQRALDTSRPALAHQSRGRPLTPNETALAAAMMDVMRAGEQDFANLAAALTQRGIVAPISGRTDWSLELLQSELTALNADFDVAYAEHGYGA